MSRATVDERDRRACEEPEERWALELTEIDARRFPIPHKSRAFDVGIGGPLGRPLEPRELARNAPAARCGRDREDHAERGARTDRVDAVGKGIMQLGRRDAHGVQRYDLGASEVCAVKVKPAEEVGWKVDAGCEGLPKNACTVRGRSDHLRCDDAAEHHAENKREAKLDDDGTRKPRRIGMVDVRGAHGLVFADAIEESGKRRLDPAPKRRPRIHDAFAGLAADRGLR